MYPINNITETYFFVDELLKILKNSQFWDKLPKWNPYSKGKKKGLSLSEVITLNIIAVLGHFSDLKAFHRNAYLYLKKDFPKLPNYENFLKATNYSLPFLVLVMQLLLNLTKFYSRHTKKYVDSTPLPVCKNRRISRNKVCKGVAQRGKTTIGWFYGFKLHGICDANGALLAITFTPGNIDDRKVLDTLFNGLNGLIIGDAGYILKNKEWKSFLNKNIHLFTSVRNNMKKIMTKEQHEELKKREIIETVWSVLKGNLSIIYTLARSITGMFRHFLYSILAYFFRYIINGQVLIGKKT